MPTSSADALSTPDNLLTRVRLPAWLTSRLWLENTLIVALTFAAISAWLFVFDRIVPTYHNGWAIYWPFNGLTTAVLLMARRRRWPYILAGFACTFVRYEYVGREPGLEIFTDVACNIVEVLLGALFLPPFRDLQQWLLEKNLIVRFFLFPVIFGPALLSLPVSLYFTTRFPGSFWRNVNDWAFADALGAALWIPMVFVLFSKETYRLFRWRKLPETLILFALLSSVTWFAFRQDTYPLSFLSYPVLLFVALRLRFNGAVIGANLLAILVASLSVRNQGPFHMDARALDTPLAIVVQLYCTLAVLLVFPLSITLVERRNFARRLQEALVEMKQQATTDKLTGLANRRQFDYVLDLEWRRAVRTQNPIGLVMVDADYFKAYNDHYGHLGGDECLRNIASILNAGAHRHHDLIARYGGEEFAVLLPGASEEFAHEFAERTRRAIVTANIPHAKNPHGSITVSAGCASMVPQLGVPEDELIVAADRALYAAKLAGRNCVVDADLARL